MQISSIDDLLNNYNDDCALGQVTTRLLVESMGQQIPSLNIPPFRNCKNMPNFDGVGALSDIDVYRIGQYLELWKKFRAVKVVAGTNLDNCNLMIDRLNGVIGDHKN